VIAERRGRTTAARNDCGCRDSLARRCGGVHITGCRLIAGPVTAAVLAGGALRVLTSRPVVHLGHRSDWLRAAVLGAHDGMLQTASPVLGRGGVGASRAAIVTAGIAGLVARGLSMAAGEYVSVGAEQADIDLEECDLPSPQRAK
jgi:VIT1/CCC1 family predicted Fe2+/Mn2+ transporter